MNDLGKPVHDLVPVILVLSQDVGKKRLPANRNLSHSAFTAEAYPSHEMEAYEVSRVVGSERSIFAGVCGASGVHLMVDMAILYLSGWGGFYFRLWSVGLGVRNAHALKLVVAEIHSTQQSQEYTNIQ
jgi:hypothetical protein